MSRPLEFDKTAALEKAMEVFWEKGYEAASLQDLIDAMELSKSSFYQTFKSKQDLYATALDHYVDLMSGMMSNSLADCGSGLGFIENVFMGIADSAMLAESRRGCFLMNTATEFAQKNEKIATLTDAGLRKFQNVFLRAIEKARESGEIPKTSHAETLSLYLVCNMSGIKSLVKAGINPDALRLLVSKIIDSLK